MQLSRLCLRLACLNLGLQRYLANGQIDEQAAMDFHHELTFLEANAQDLGDAAPDSDWDMIRESLYTTIDDARGYLAKHGFARPS